MRAPYLLFSLLFICSGASAGDHGEGTLRVEGEVFNATLERPGPEGLQVTLLSVEGESLKPLGRTKTLAGGRFSFSPAPSKERAHLVAVAEYGGVPYMVRVDPGGKARRLLIYETTAEMVDIAVESHQILVTFEGGSSGAMPGMEMGGSREGAGPRLIFHEVLRLVNRGKTTYVGRDQVTLRFSLPPGADLLSPPQGLMPDTLRKGPDGWAASDPIPPGVKEISLLYKVPDPPPQLAVEKEIGLPTARLDLLAPELGMRLASRDLSIQRAVEIQGTRYHYFAGADLKPGLRLRFVVSRDIESPWSSRLFFLLLAALAGGLSIPFWVRRGRRRLAGKAGGQPVRRPEGAGSRQKGDAKEERERVLAEIAALDNAHQSGRVLEEDYARRRQELFRRALELTKTLKGP